MSGASGAGEPRYYLYLPVWATGTPPDGGGSGGLSSSGSTFTESEPSASSASSGSTFTESEPSGSGSGSGASSAASSSGAGSSGSSSGGSSGSGESESGGESSGGGSSGGGSSDSGASSGGGSSGGESSGGGSSSGGNCLLVGTLVRLADGRLTPIENLRPGDPIASVRLPGLEVDVPYRAQYDWLSHHGLRGARRVAGRVASVTLGEHEGFIVINRRLKATPEHPVLVRREDHCGFASAELVQPGDFLIDDVFNDELVESVERVDAPARTVAIHIPGANTLLAEGIWVHNDTMGSSGGGSSGSGGKSSGSSFSSSDSGGGGSSGASFTGPTSLGSGSPA